MPLVSVSVISLEGVMEVVVAFPIGEQGEQWWVSWCVCSRVRLRAPGVGSRVDQKRSMMNDDHTEQTAPNEAAKESRDAAKEEPSKNPGEHHSNKETKQEYMAILKR